MIKTVSICFFFNNDLLAFRRTGKENQLNGAKNGNLAEGISNYHINIKIT